VRGLIIPRIYVEVRLLAGPTLTHGVNVVPWDTEDKDLSDSFNISTGVFTAPRDDVYDVYAGLEFVNSVYTADKQPRLYIYKNNAAYKGIAIYSQFGGVNSNPPLYGSFPVPLLAGETLDVRTALTAPDSYQINADTQRNYLSIVGRKGT
jgi:hypothetical protein